MHYTTVFPANNSRNRRAASLPGKVSRINRLKLTVVSQLESNVNAYVTDSDICNRGHQLVKATIPECFRHTIVIEPNIVRPKHMLDPHTARCLQIGIFAPTQYVAENKDIVINTK